MKNKLLVMFTLCTAFTLGNTYAQGAAPAGARAGGGMGGGARMGGGMGGGMGGFNTQPPGPPAPVPPAVAIPRPSQAEMDQVKAGFQKFIDASPDKEILKKYESLVTIQGPRDNPCIRPTTPRGGQHTRFVETATTGDFDILLLGDSITDLLNVDADPQGNPGGKPALQKYLGDQKVANFGISGDTTQGVLGRLQNGEGQGHKPKAVMMMIGTNNTGGASGPEIAEGIGALTLQLRKDFPDAKIMIVSIFPRGANANDSNRKKVEECNKIIAKLHDGKNVFYVDLWNKFLKPDGSLIGMRPSDNLHPVAEGFDIWISSVAPTLKEWVKK